MRTIKKFLSIALIGILCFSLAGCGGSKEKKANSAEAEPSNGSVVQVPLEQVEQMNAQSQSLTEKVSTQQLEISELKDQVNTLLADNEFYSSYIEEVVNNFTPQQLESLANKEWTYTLFVNDILFPKSGVIETSKTSFNLSLGEERVRYSVIPESLSENRRFSSSLSGALKISASVDPIKSEESLSEYNNRVIYRFTDLAPGTNIKITVSAELQELLGLETKELTIKITK